MNEDHEIYKMVKEQNDLLDHDIAHLDADAAAERMKLEKDIARLDGYLAGKAEAALLRKGANRDLSKHGSKNDD